MIVPREDLELRAERPPIEELTPLQNLFAWLAGKFFMARQLANYERRNRRLNELFTELRGRDTREAIEELLGKPRYAMVAHRYGSQNNHPDFVEVYQRDGCMFELWFKNGTLGPMTACVPYSMWDIATGMAQKITRDHFKELRTG